jgi:formylglycine-generating enzyme required for sulfatase activity
MKTMRAAALFCWALGLILLLGDLPAGAGTTTRVALVIGNGAYEHTLRLPNPVNDATDIAASLGSLGYSVQLVKDATKVDMEVALARFAGVARGADQVMIYYSGHGMEVKGINYLLPLDASIESETTVPLEAVSLPTVMDIAAGARQLGMVVLDACRSNPLADTMQRVDGTRGAYSRGLQRVEPHGNLLVAYATREGAVAADGDGRNSPYTTAILSALQKPGLEVRLFWGLVRDSVLSATQDKQEPAIYGSLGAEQIFLNSLDSSPSLSAADTTVPPTTVQLAAPGAPPTPDTGKVQAFRDCPACPEMVAIPAGSFKMGSPASESHRADDEGPQHPVQIRSAFSVSRYPITRAEWKEFVKATGHKDSTNCLEGQRDDHPVVCVRWEDAQDYITWLSTQAKQHYRLLSEAEYEYISRANSTTPYGWGDSSDAQCTYANGADAATQSAHPGWSWPMAPCNDKFPVTSPVGSFPPNAFGLFDTTGNVYSWTQDCWHSNYRGAPVNGSAWEGWGCDDRVVRGGSWHDVPWWLRAAHRSKQHSSRDDVGFRVARSSGSTR